MSKRTIIGSAAFTGTSGREDDTLRSMVSFLRSGDEASHVLSDAQTYTGDCTLQIWQDRDCQGAEVNRLSRVSVRYLCMMGMYADEDRSIIRRCMALIRSALAMRTGRAYRLLAQIPEVLFCILSLHQLASVRGTRGEI